MVIVFTQQRYIFMAGFDSVAKDAKSIGGTVSGLLVTLGGIGAGFMIASSDETNTTIDTMLAKVGVTNSLLQEAIILGVQGSMAMLTTNMYNKVKSKIVKMVFGFFAALLWTVFGIRAFNDFMSVVKGDLQILPGGA